jgi:hypothetical protein
MFNLHRYITYVLVAILIASGTAHAATQFDFLLSQVRTAAGPLPGGRVYFYSPGTLTLKNIWLDKSQTTLAANPYTLDSNGTAMLYGAGGYRVIVKDSAGVTKYDRAYIGAAGEDGTLQVVDATAGNQTVTLPSGGSVSIVKTDASANTVTIQPVGGQTIAGAADYVLYLQGESVSMSISGTTWHIK